MATVRRGARGFLKYFLLLVLLAVVVQVFLAGLGVFGIEEGQGLEDATSLDPHRGLGHFIGTFGGILIFLGSLLWWPRDKRLLGWFVLLAVLLFVQPIFAIIGGEFVGGLHALNALVLLGLLGWLSYGLWRGRAAVAAETV
jgi:hypothetical protein